jgi:hypothetical protein
MQTLDVLAAAEGAVHKPALLAHVLPQRFLLIKVLVVAALQPFVEVRNLIEQYRFSWGSATIALYPATGSAMNFR